MSAPCVESMRDWERRLASEAFAKGAHIPHVWNVDYDDGGDGCMPAGWYLIGLCRNGVPIDFPVRHEYGPFDSENEARGYIAELCADSPPARAAIAKATGGAK